VTLHDAAYNADRNIATGNPNTDLVADPMKRGVRGRPRAHNWGNADLFPSIKVNTDARARATEKHLRHLLSSYYNIITKFARTCR